MSKKLKWSEWEAVQPETHTQGIKHIQAVSESGEKGSFGAVTFHPLPYEAEWSGIYLGHYTTLEEAREVVAARDEKWRKRE